ncbi:MAG: hypothetical protein LBM68_03835 [Bacteroidales bacterium]|jgi:hypothetical protein|nr:hypothetical protein [Bacteroidales bacterium]
MTTAERKKVKELQNELLSLMLKKAGVTKQAIYDVAIRSWVAKNTDLLSSTEIQKYKSVLL